MRINLDVNTEELEIEIKKLLEKAREKIYDYSNLNNILIAIEDINSKNKLKIQENQKRVSDFLKNNKGIFGGVFLIIFLVVILFLIIIIALMR